MQLNSKIKCLKKNSKSFYWASNLLNKNKINEISELYCVLRELDDVADNSDNEKEIFEELLAYIRKENQNLNVRFEAHENFFKSIKSSQEKKENFLNFLDGLIYDQQDHLEVKNNSELIEYCYRVAGTVGIMMCPILEVSNKDAYKYAADLGIAMQLTNISRDVYEDACNNRRYLPSSSCNEIKPEEIREIFNDKKCESYKEIKKSIESILNIADDYYEKAKKGYSYMPLRSRICISVAANIYREIGNDIKRNKCHWSSKRYFIPMYRKLFITLKTFFNELIRI
jgi:phytoene synthase|tara:strand:+ start:78175 stop:79026 length:852 start_codon:yes stop_codon:yes gene_type:complete